MAYYNKSRWLAAMKRILGICCFAAALGILLDLLIGNTLVAIVLIALLLLLGYNLFSCGC